MTPFDDIDRMFDRMSNGFEGMSRDFDSMTRGRGEAPLDIADYDDEIVVVADLPGFESDGITVTLDEDRLSIEATRDDRSDDGDETYVRRERRLSSVRRTVRLPSEVIEDEATATYANGVLTVTLPKLSVSEADDAHRIDVE